MPVERPAARRRSLAAAHRAWAIEGARRQRGRSERSQFAMVVCMDRDDIIYLRTQGGMSRLERHEFEQEVDLQKLITDHPDVLSGRELSPNEALRWLVISLEASIADREHGAGRWALDALLVDQHGILTFVEVKRSTDTRIRREVVGQMLEYAANATAHWPEHRVRELAAVRAGGEDRLRERVRELLGPTVDEARVESFWGDVQDNLRQGRMRLLVVADAIPSELRRLIEFLNDHMPEVDVAGIEVGRYLSPAGEAFVPRVVGVTERSRGKKEEQRGPLVKTTREAILEACPEVTRKLIADFWDECESRGMRLELGTKGLSVRLPLPTGPVSLFYCYPPGANGRTFPHLQVYVAGLPEELRPDVLARAEALGFEGTSAYTRNLNVNGDVVGRFHEVKQQLLGIADRLQQPRAG